MSDIPQRTMEALARYLDRGLDPGLFLTYVLQNDLLGARRMATMESWPALGATIDWLYHNAPSYAWGSPEKVAAYVTAKRTAATS